MLGNVKPYMPALSETAKTRYGAFYCGLCQALGHSHGLFSRFLLNYDMAFVAVIHSELNGEEYETLHRGCIANPFKKKYILRVSPSTAYSADVLMMLAYFKLKDNIADEGFIKKLGCRIVSPYFYIKYRHAKKLHPQLAAILENETAHQLKLEKESTDIDRLSMPTANMVKAIMKGCSRENSFALEQFGFFLGRLIYLLDALCDRKEDRKNNKFNIFNIKELADDEAKAECFMALGEMAHRYSQMNITENKEITDNIIYLSLARKIKFAGEEEKESENG